MSKKMISKITIVFLSMLLAAALAGNTWATSDNDKRTESQTKPHQKKKIKNIILFIGDGMQLEHEIATSQYLTGEEYFLVWHRWNKKAKSYAAPVSTWDVTTYNKYALANGGQPYDPNNFDPLFGYSPALGGSWPFPIDDTGLDDYFLKQIGATDSASAATAWATGYKTDEGNIAWMPGDPADGALETIAELMRDQLGSAMGVVSTVPFSHATPAAHVSHNVNRNKYFEIADEIIRTTKPEVVIGGGWPYDNKFTYIPSTLYDDVKNGVVSDYQFVERTAGKDGGAAIMAGAAQAAASGKKLFGLFGGPGGNFESPIPSDTPGAPSITRGSIENPLLSHATMAALNVLSQDPDGFFVMIEQGDIDWANHDNNFSQMIGCTWDLDQAIQATVRFVNRPKDHIDWSNTLLIVTADHSNSYMRLARADNGQPQLGIGDLPEQVPNAAPTGSYTPKYIYPTGEVTYGSPSHTDELVMLYAFGIYYNYLSQYEGTWYPGTDIIDNTQVFKAMAEATGLEISAE